MQPAIRMAAFFCSHRLGSPRGGSSSKEKLRIDFSRAAACLKSMGILGKRGWVCARVLCATLAVSTYGRVMQEALRLHGRQRVATDKVSCSAPALMRWARQHGLEAPRVAVGDLVYEDPLAPALFWLDAIQQRRGLVALQEVNQGEVILSVPWSACISTKHLQNSTHILAAMAASAKAELEQLEMLALFVLYEYHNPNSAWAPYLCLMPRMPTGTIFRTAGPPETSTLRLSLKERFTQRVLPFVARFYSVYPNDILTLSNFLWAFGAVKARAWGVPWEGQVLAVIAPVADLVTYQHSTRGGARMSRLKLTAAGTGVHSGWGVAMGLSAARGHGGWGIGTEGWEEPVLEVFVGANFSRGQVCVGRGPTLNSCRMHGVWFGICARAGTHAHPERSSQAHNCMLQEVTIARPDDCHEQPSLNNGLSSRDPAPLCVLDGTSRGKWVGRREGRVQALGLLSI